MNFDTEILLVIVGIVISIFLRITIGARQERKNSANNEINMKSHILSRIVVDSKFEIEFSIFSSNIILPHSKNINGSELFKTENSTITILAETTAEHVSSKYKVDGFYGYAFLINKNTDAQEDIRLTLKVNPSSACEYDIATGEYLLAREFISDNLVLHIGTADEESLFQRASLNEFFPERFCKEHPIDDKFWIEMIRFDQNEITINVPGLKPGEQIYFHLLCSWKNNSTIDDISTWMAVDWSYSKIKQILNKLT